MKRLSLSSLADPELPRIVSCGTLILIFTISLFTGCNRDNASTQTAPRQRFIDSTKRKPDEVTELARAFFVKWLKASGEANIIDDETGVGVSNNDIRLWAFQQSMTLKKKEWLAEVDFRVAFPDGREIVEVVGGSGKTKDAAIDSCLANYSLSTLHVVYSCYINPRDAQIEIDRAEINGVPWMFFSAGMMTMSGEEPPDFDDVATEIRKKLADTPLNNQMHWAKILYGRSSDGTVFECSVTIDNETSKSLAQAVRNLDWPHNDTTYLAKYFLVLRPVGL